MKFMQRLSLVIVAFFALGNEHAAAQTITTVEDLEKLDQMCQYIKKARAEYDQPEYDKANGPVGSKGKMIKTEYGGISYEREISSGDLDYYYTYPFGPNEPPTYVVRNANRVPTSFTFWGVGPYLYGWIGEHYIHQSFPYVIGGDYTGRERHGTKPRPQGKATIKVNANQLIIETYYDYQISPFDGKGGHIVGLGDPFNRHLKCRVNGKTTTEADFKFNKFPGEFTVKGTSVCNKHYIKFVDLGLIQVPHGNGMYKIERSSGLEDATYKSCWFVAHWQTTTFQLDDIAKACGKTRREIEDMILTGGFKSFWIAQDASPVNYMLSYSLLANRGLNLKQMEAKSEYYHRRKDFLQDSIAAEKEYIKQLFANFPEIKAHAVEWKKQMDEELNVERKKNHAVYTVLFDSLDRPELRRMYEVYYRRIRDQRIHEVDSTYQSLMANISDQNVIDAFKKEHQESKEKIREEYDIALQQVDETVGTLVTEKELVDKINDLKAKMPSDEAHKIFMEKHKQLMKEFSAADDAKTKEIVNRADAELNKYQVDLENNDERVKAFLLNFYKEHPHFRRKM